MAHTSLYRKYRPQSFDDIVGQRHITRTLRNAVAENAVAHAYLFTGPRGTGKTTTARVLAKALLCESGPTPDPDTTCQQCIDVAEGRHPDVHELDAASRTGVEHVREEIIARLAYATARGRWRIYIIDEVHMLSTGAFNALLKSIEEPPPNTVFILCTTHPHKVPETIHSRCQRFDFHRIGVEDIAERLTLIAQREGIVIDSNATVLIAKHAMGALRDAITTLEQLAAFTGKKISLDDVEGLLGEVDAELLFEAADLVLRRDVAEGFRFMARLSESGVDTTEFVRSFTGHVRDLFVTAAVGDPQGIVDSTSEHLGRLASQARAFGTERLARILDVLGALASELRWSSDPRLSLEVALTRMAHPGSDLTLEALAERIEALEAGAPVRPASSVLAAGVATGEDTEGAVVESDESAGAAGSEVVRAEPGHLVAQDPDVEVRERAAGAHLDRARAKRAWPAVVAEIKKMKASRAHIVANTEVDVDADGYTLVIEFPAEQQFTMELASAPDTREMIASALSRVLGSAPPFRYQLGRGAVRATPVEETGERRIDAPVANGGDETVSPDVHREPESSGADEAEIERLLRTEFGAEMVAEHPHESDDGKDGA